MAGRGKRKRGSGTRKRGSDPRVRIYSVVRRIPEGRVATYGQVARLAGLPGHARQVGYALHALGGPSRLPWHRVVNRLGGISLRRLPGPEITQRKRLEREGVAFDARGRVPLRKYLWQSGSAAAGKPGGAGRARKR